MIVLEDVHMTLQSQAGPVNILRGARLRARAGERLAVVGPSGAGKTTLLMLMAGLERATSGLVQVAGQDLTPLDEDQLAAFRLRNVGIVFQSFHLAPSMTALENAALPLEFARDPHAADRARQALDRVGLARRADHYPAQLSGGEQQRVALARALAAGPRLILADEPTGNLDHATGLKVVDMLFDLVRQSGATLVLVTHDQGLAARCDRVAHMEDGVIQDQP
ncbi:putative ABC transporter ATP-binding protein [Fundidesulfovibrio magnetotacticus]|uniref:Putative ABC transporter ATP-binding protein n=2 Tax=Fundidesulfovibrio magnetotacticus TaxID=2730080 RepID=A0A6V8LQ22_9BACT|nr:putative ABC transporter ATP-binding protein [Fundidesulfovibrio magnetotacticus]